MEQRAPSLPAERWLRGLLRCAASVLLLAFPATLLPEPWMEATHARLGLGDFPASPLVDYLTRSIALLYGFHGVLLWLISGNVRRYRSLVIYCGVMNVVFGIAVLAVDAHAGLPWYWIVAEGPPILGLGVVVLWLVRDVPPSRGWT